MDELVRNYSKKNRIENERLKVDASNRIYMKLFNICFSVFLIDEVLFCKIIRAKTE